MSRPNRRNFYRVLHVQSDAPEAIIRAAYRTLMQKLRLHPDLGGDGTAAALINEAYTVLSDPARRAAYDAQTNMRFPRTPPRGPIDRSRPLPVGASARVAQERRPAPIAPATCAFCAAALPPPSSQATRCATCASPLTPPPQTRQIASTRRAFERHTVLLHADYFVRGDAAPRPATLIDFSPRGALIGAASAAADGIVIALKTPLLDALARVIGCAYSPHGPGSWLVRLEFLTLALTAPAGSLLSTEA